MSEDVIYKTSCKICGCDVNFADEESIGYLKVASSTVNAGSHEWSYEFKINFPDQLEICLDCYRKEIDLISEHMYATYCILSTGVGSHDDVIQPIRL